MKIYENEANNSFFLELNVDERRSLPQLDLRSLQAARQPIQEPFHAS